MTTDSPAVPHRRPSALIFPVRMLGTVAASAVFGLVAARAFEPWSIWAAVGLGFLFGTFFIAGTGYRILLAVWQRQLRYAPTSWSGAAAASAVATGVGFVVLALNGPDSAYLLLAFALAINLAYLCVKASCLLAGCCGGPVTMFGHVADLRHVEIGWGLLILLTAGTVGTVDAAGGAALGILGHTGLRLVSRARRGRFSLGWPPLRQPGAELAPLYLTLALALAAWI